MTQRNPGETWQEKRGPVDSGNPWCGLCADRRAHVQHEAGSRQALHLERDHGYNFWTGKPGEPHPDPLEAPYALDQLHKTLHDRGDRHASRPGLATT